LLYPVPIVERIELPRSLESLDAMFSFLEEHMGKASVDQRVAFHIKLAADELFTNMVRYNETESDSIGMGFEIAGGRIRIQLIDRGVAPFDPAGAPDPKVERPMEERTPGGLGIHLVKSVCDEVTYEYRNGSMEITIVKELGSQDV
jgi:serine/threonine-protein kinase RsbW